MKVAALARIVVDTNVLLSGLACPSSVPGRILAVWRQGTLDVVLSAYILDELRRVLPRLEHRHGLSAVEIDDLVDILAIQSELIELDETVEQVAGLRDPNDQPVIGALLSALQPGRADFLITGDKDLLALSDRYPILTPAQFWGRYGGAD